MIAGVNGTAVIEGTPLFVRGYLPVDDRLEDRLIGIRGRVSGLPEFGLDTGSGEMTITYAEERGLG